MLFTFTCMVIILQLKHVKYMKYRVKKILVFMCVCVKEPPSLLAFEILADANHISYFLWPKALAQG